MTIEKDIEAALRTPMSAEQRAVVDARVRAAIAQALPAARGRFQVRRSLLLVAVLVLVPVVGAGAAILSTETPLGIASAAEFAAELEAAKEEVPLPVGRTWPAGPSLAVNPDAGYSRGGGRSTVEAVAFCIWLDEWLDAREAGDADREHAAATTVAAVPTWPSWTSPFWTESYTDHLQGLITAVGDGDEAPVRQEMELNCDFAANQP